jgi:hypothetical protein
MTQNCSRMFIVWVLAAACLVSCPASAMQVSLPLRADLAVVRQALREQVYKEPGEQCTLSGDGGKCLTVRLYHPLVSARMGRLRIMSGAHARPGAEAARECPAYAEWRGLVEVIAEPRIEPGSRVLTLKIIETVFYDEHQKRATVAAALRDAIARGIEKRFATLQVDLTPQVQQFLSLVSSFLPQQAAAGRLSETVSLSRPLLFRESFSVTVTMQTTALTPAGQTTPLQDAAAQKILDMRKRQLERWDAFLTFVIKTLARNNNPGPMRQALLGILLDARHAIIEQMVLLPQQAQDPVPRLFVRTWEQLKTIMTLQNRRIRQRNREQENFVFAVDGLAALARQPQKTGFEVSDDGLRSLARTLAPGSTEDPVRYDTAVDPELRRLLGFGAPPPAPHIDPGIYLSSAQTPAHGSMLKNCSCWALAAWFSADACAAAEPAAHAQLNGWVPSKKDLGKYLSLVRSLLRSLCEETLAQSNLEEKYHGVYRNLVLATAWQESCWRQFIRKGDMVLPLKSGAGSVGLMQINQRVWRGIYDQKGLLGDISYNGRAGCEILLHYLRDFAIARGEHLQTGGMDNVCRATYAVYNGGPAHLSRYRQPGTKESLKNIDRLWWQKYQAVSAGKELEVAGCYE